MERIVKFTEIRIFIVIELLRLFFWINYSFLILREYFCTDVKFLNLIASFLFNTERELIYLA